MNKKKQTKNMLMDMTIEEQLLKIQEIAAELENGSLGLEEARFQRTLTNGMREFERIKGKFENGYDARFFDERLD